MKVTDLDRIFASAPLDRQAAVVAGGANGTDDLSPKQQRENLIGTINRIETLLKLPITPDQREQLGQRKQAVQKALSELRSQMKQPPSVPLAFLDAARELLPKATFQMLWEIAHRRALDPAVRMGNSALSADAAPPESATSTNGRRSHADPRCPPPARTPRA
jgi:hypothetical protein